jgi:hypothetical protein
MIGIYFHDRLYLLDRCIHIILCGYVEIISAKSIYVIELVI